MHCVVTTESSTTGDGPQQDGGDIGSSVIEHLPAGVSAQCKLSSMHAYVHIYIHAMCSS